MARSICTCALSAHRAAPVCGQGFRQHQHAIGQIQQRQAPGHEEGQAQVDAPKQPAHHGAENEADAEHRAQQTETACTLFGRRDVGHVSTGHGRIGLHGTAHHA
jgi:hypothetical protein